MSASWFNQKKTHGNQTYIWTIVTKEKKFEVSKSADLAAFTTQPTNPPSPAFCIFAHVKSFGYFGFLAQH